MKTYSALLMIAILASVLFAQTESIVADTNENIIPDPPVIKNSELAQPQINGQSDTSINSVVYPFPYFKSGEAIKISVFPDSLLFLNGFYSIDQDGYVNLPILGLVSVRNRTINEFISLIKKEYTDFLRYPHVNVTSYTRVSFFGGFSKPGLYWIDSRSSLWDAIQVAGGVDREDGLKNIRWERNGTIVSKNIIADFQAGTSLQKIGFKSGDQLCVTGKPRMNFWESFRQDVIPILSISLTALTTALTAYQTYRIYNHNND